MSGISSGVGLISGIDSGKLIDQLIAIDSRPVDALRARVQALDTKRTAFAEISAQILAIKNALASFTKTSFFRRFSAKSSKDGILSVTPSESASAGSTTLRVHSLVSSHSVISRGFANADRATVGAGTITIEVGNGRVNTATDLGDLNGGAGVRRGVITITDRSGASADVDLRTAVTVEDVLDAINSDSRIRVRARVTGLPSVSSDGSETKGERIVLEDVSGGTGAFRVVDKNGGSTAADLGIAGEVTAARLDGRNIVRLTADTPLDILNDGNGIDRLRRGNDLAFHTSFGDFNVSLTDILEPSTDLRALNSGRGVRLGVIRITDRTGKSVEVDLRELSSLPRITAQDVRQKITQALETAGVAASITTVNSSFLINDTSTPGATPKPFLVEDVSGFAAEDLGIAGKKDDGAILGRAVYRVSTVGDVIQAINNATGNDGLVQASVADDGNGIVLRALGFNNSVTVSAGTNTDGGVSTAARDLGLIGAAFSPNADFQSRPLIAGLNTVLLSSLNGGAGFQGGKVAFTDVQGRTTEIDFASARTLQDVIDLINTNGATSIRAAINTSGNGIALRDESGASGSIAVNDIAGDFAANLGVAGRFDVASDRGVQGGNLQLQYVSRNTQLTDLNGGRGVALGDFRITDSTGAIFSISLARNLTTVGQVIDAINFATPDTIEARLNDNGDGIIITDTTTGTKQLLIEDTQGRSAADLRLAGTAKAGERSINGSYEVRIEVSAGDSLDKVVAKLRSASDLFSASVLRDGSRANAYSLTIASNVSGRRGELLIDTGGIDLGLSTLSRARDAIVTLGGSNALNPILLTSSTNRIEGAVSGVTFDLLATSNEDVTVSITQDREGVEKSIETFIEQYNDAMDKLTERSSFNSETLERGTLFGDSTVDLIQSRLFRSVLQGYRTSDPSVSRLFSAGVRVGVGNRLEFDETRFRDAYARAPRAVEELFSKAETGFAASLQKSLNGLTQDTNGTLARKDSVLNDQKELLNDRIVSLDALLQAKRSRLEAQFAALETALAGLQQQQTSLAGLTQLASSV